MQKFCTKCGHKLDEKTGLCPNCDKSKRTARKIKGCFFTGCVLFFILCIFCIGISGFLTFKGYVDIPVLRTAMESIDIAPNVEREIPETDMDGLEYYQSSEENIVTDDEATYVNNEILVMLKGIQYRPELERYLSSIGGNIVGYIEQVAQYQILLNREYSFDELNNLIRTIENFDWVIYASPNFAEKYSILYEPNDKKWAKEWDTIPEGDNWGMEAIDALEAWDYYDRMSTVNIGIFDNMFDISHEDLIFAEMPLGQVKVSNLIADSNSDVSWDDHGTHTSGTVAALFNNDKGVTGVCPKVNLYGVSAVGLETNGYIMSQTFNMAFSYLIINKNCSVINISLAFDQITFEASRNEQYASNQIRNMSEAISNFLKSLIDDNYQFVICKAAGNQNEVGNLNYSYFRKDSDDSNTMYSFYSYGSYKEYLDDGKNEEIFGRYKNREKEIEGKLESGNVDAKYDVMGAITDEEVKKRIIMVGAVKNLGTTRDGWFGIIGNKVHKGYDIAEWSQCGERVDVLAPGVDIYSTERNGYGEKSGTSMAAPHVAGVAGLLFSVAPNIKGDQVKQIIHDSATGSYGTEKYGMLNANIAVQAALSQSVMEIPDNKGDMDGGSPSSNNLERVTSDERDIVLVLDVSGSMSGDPMEETKKASSNFINTILKEDASIGIVTYENSANMLSDFSVDEQSLTSIANNITDGGGTNIESGLVKAKEMLAESNAKKKIIVLMSDGEPNDGKVGDELISYADSIKADGTYIYTLGFFESMGSGKSDAQILMEEIASDGCHYEVANADDLRFFFGDIADQINGQKYIYVRIACPVDVNVTYGDETLSSIESDIVTRTSFGTLTFEENPNKSEDSTDDRIKILRLKDGTDYDIQIAGNGTGTMNYTIGFMDEAGEYSDLREFNDIEISNRTQIDTVAQNVSSTTLNVDSDGDGKYDLKYKAKANSVGEIVDYSYIRHIIYIAGILTILLILYIQIKKWKRKSVEKAIKKKASQKRFCVHCGNMVSWDKKFCPKCGNKMEKIN